MEMDAAIVALRALAQESRLAVFRLLIESGDAGLPAGEIARDVGIPHNTLSTHLGILSHAGLAQSRRVGRSIIYTANFDGTRALLGFLMQDCCKGSPAVCVPLLDAILPGCCDGDSSFARSVQP